MDYTRLLQQIEQHQRTFFQSNYDPAFVYHNLAHTEKVVAAADELAQHYKLSPRDRFVVIAAAWFHDTGYFVDSTNHERKGADLADEFLAAQGVAQPEREAIRNCILATHMPQLPRNLLEEIVCDADLFHLGTEAFSENNKNMRREWELRSGTKVPKSEWRRKTIHLMEIHRYFTGYARNKLQPVKDQHLQQMKEKLQKSDEAVSMSLTTSSEDPKKNRPDRGIETMFRITSNNNQRLSDMADNKAQIMITVNSIILSAVISILLRKLEEYSYLAWPTYAILTVSVLTIIFSILATRPNLFSGKFTKEDIDKKKVNLLFFGNFHKMNLDDYMAGMKEVMNDREFLYGTLIKDVYAQGVVLGRKYRLLRISYNIFMFGLILSVLAFVIASITAGR